MADVFISYSRDNLAFAQRLAEAVAREGYSVWWDRDLPPHLSYGKVITETIGAARAAIVIWSDSAAESEWVRAEADLARTEKKLIQTSIDDRMPPMPFNQIQFAPIGDWNGEADHPGWIKVKASLAALCGPARPGSGATAAAVTPPILSRPPAQRDGRPRTVSGARIAGAALAAVVLVSVAAAAILWLRSGEPAQAERVEAQATPAAQPGSPRRAIEGQPPRGARALFTEAAVIDDPDGYTNVRSGPSANFAAVARVNRGEVFTTYPQNGDWWQVRTADGRVGYMARSRIRPIDAGGIATADEPTGLAGDGEAALAAAPTAAANPPQILPESSRRRLSEADLAGLSAAQIRLGRNEIFARHGRVFRDPQLRRHFELYPWYSPRPGPIALSPVEEANVRLLQQAEPKR